MTAVTQPDWPAALAEQATGIEQRSREQAALDIAVTALAVIREAGTVGIAWTEYHRIVSAACRLALADIAALRGEP